MKLFSYYNVLLTDLVLKFLLLFFSIVWIYDSNIHHYEIAQNILFFYFSDDTVFYLCSQESVKHQTRFVSQKPAKVVLSSMEVVAQSMGYKTHIRNYKVE